MARKSGIRTVKLAGRLAFSAGLVGFFGMLVGSFALIQSIGGGAKAWVIALLVCLVVGIAAAIVAWMQGSQIGHRVTDVGLAVAKIGRGGSEVRVRVHGND